MAGQSVATRMPDQAAKMERFLTPSSNPLELAGTASLEHLGVQRISGANGSQPIRAE
jgi:hypothetical protein